MNFNTFGETIFLRLQRSCRVAEKSDPIGSREPNYVIFGKFTPEVSGNVNLYLQSTARWQAARLGSTSIALH